MDVESDELVLCTYTVPWYTPACRPAGFTPIVIVAALAVLPEVVNGISQPTPSCVISLTLKLSGVVPEMVTDCVGTLLSAAPTVTVKLGAGDDVESADGP